MIHAPFRQALERYDISFFPTALCHRYPNQNNALSPFHPTISSSHCYDTHIASFPPSFHLQWLSKFNFGDTQPAHKRAQVRAYRVSLLQNACTSSPATPDRPTITMTRLTHCKLDSRFAAESDLGNRFARHLTAALLAPHWLQPGIGPRIRLDFIDNDLMACSTRFVTRRCSSTLVEQDASMGVSSLIDSRVVHNAGSRCKVVDGGREMAYNALNASCCQ